MGSRENEELIIILLIENRVLKKDGNDFYDFLKEHYNLEDFNKRYSELLDNFMNQYALDKTEKSE